MQEALASFGVKQNPPREHPPEDEDDVAMIRMRIGAKDRRKLHMKGHVEMEEFQNGEYKGTFVVLARDLVSVWSSVAVWCGCGLKRRADVVIFSGEPSRVARDVERARAASTHRPSRL